MMESENDTSYEHIEGAESPNDKATKTTVIDNLPQHPTKEQLLEELAEDYANYLEVNIADENDLLVENIDEMLTKLDEYCGLADLIRSDTSQSLERTLPTIQKKTADIHQVFERIDQLENFVNMVRGNVNAMERQVDQAESEMSSLKSIKKMFSNLPSFLSPKKQESPVTESVPSFKYDPPAIFETEKMLRYEALPSVVSKETLESNTKTLNL